jgi:hypothetical protein
MFVDMESTMALEGARDLAVLLLVPLGLLAAVDGLYLHLWRLRLHERPESRREHLLHSARAVLFAPCLALVYGFESAGGWLWAGVALAVVDTALEGWDTFEEPGSRRAIGGLTAAEALLHVVLVTLRAVSLVLVLISLPAAAWSWSTPGTLREVEPWQAIVVWTGLLPGATGVAALHVVLAVRTRHARLRTA